VRGATVVTPTAPWSLHQKLTDLARGSHQSARQHVEFLCEEFIEIIKEGHWVMLSALLLLYEKNLSLSPLGVVPQRNFCPRTICDYPVFLINDDTIEL
jgi:hypothetical protein